MKFRLFIIAALATIALWSCCDKFNQQFAIDEFTTANPSVEILKVSDYSCSGVADCSCWYVDITFRETENSELKDTTIQYWSDNKGETWINRTDYLKSQK